MFGTFDIKELWRGKMKNIFLLAAALLLNGCGGDDATACLTIQDNISGCVLCGFFRILQQSAVHLADTSWQNLAKPLSILVLVIAAIYVAVNTLKMVSSFGKQNVADYLTSEKNGLFLMLFKATVIYFLLANGIDIILQYLIHPLISAAVEISYKLAPSPVITAGTVKDLSWNGIFNMVISGVESFNQSVYMIVGLGEALACTATIGGLFHWQFLMLIYGTMIFVFGWLLLAGISFYLVDIVIRLTFAAILLPVGIACAISKLSVTYTKNIWNLFLNVFFSLIILGIVLSITLQVVLLCVGGNLGASATVGAYQASFVRAIDENSIHTVAAMIQSFGYFLLTAVCFCVIYQLVSQMGQLAEKISDTFGFTPASQAMAPIAKAPLQDAKRIGSWAGGVATGTTTGLAKQIGHDVSRATRLDKLYKWSGDKANAVRGIVTGTGSQGYKAWWHKIGR